MRYYVIEIATGDTKISGKSIYEFDSVTAAIASWHQRLATAMKSELFTSDLVMVVDSNGTVIKREKWAVPVETETDTAE